MKGTTIKIMSAATTTPDSAARKREIYKAAFKKFDADDSNSIDTAELGSLLKELGWNVSDADVTEALTVLDKDGNGDIDLDEFLNWSEYAWQKFVLRSPTKSAANSRRLKQRGGLQMESLGELPDMDMNEE